MSRRHIATHAYDYRTGWVRIAPTALTAEQAEVLRDKGFTIVRSRRGWFGTRELPVSWYLRHAATDASPALGQPLSPAFEPPAKSDDRREGREDAVESADAPGPVAPPTRRARQRADEREQ